MAPLSIYRPIPLSFFVMTLTVMSTGCKDPGGVKGCGVELQSALLAAPDPTSDTASAQLIAHLRIFNDAPINVAVTGFAWMLEVDGQALARGNTRYMRDLTRETSHYTTIRIPLSDAGERWVANAMNKPHRQVRLMGFCRIRAAGSVREVPFDAKNDVY